MKKSLVAIGALTISLAATPALATLLNLNPGPSNNGGSANWAIFLNVEAIGPAIRVTELTTASNAAANAAFSIEVYIRTGTGLGGTLTGGPGGSANGWTLLGTAPATQGPVANAVSLPIDIPDIIVPAGGVVGVALKFLNVGPRFKDCVGGYETYQDGMAKVVTGDVRTVPFTGTGLLLTQRCLVGSITYLQIFGGTGSATPSPVPQGCNTLLSVNVVPDPTGSTGIQVRGNLSAFGGSPTQAFVETSPGSNLFTHNLSVPVNQPVGPATIVTTVTDNESHTGNGNINLTVASALLPAGSATPSPVPQGCTTELRVALTILGCAGTSGHAVTADLTGIGGSNNQAFTETPSGSGIFTYAATIPASQALGAVSLPVTAMDAQGHTANTNINLTVSPAFSIAAAVNPSAVDPGEQTLFTVQINIPACATSTGHSVIGNLTSIGGSFPQPFFDDGPSGGHGDAAAGDRIFSFLATVAPGSGPGLYLVPVSVQDAQLHQAATDILMSVGGFFELEANDSKATATVVDCLEPGRFIEGSSTGSTITGTGLINSADYYRVKTCSAPLGIYRHRLTLTTIGLPGHTATIRGLTQTAGVINAGTDAVVQTALTTASGDLPARTVQWYGFGKEEEIYYRVTGTASTTGTYSSTPATTAVVPVQATQTYAPGDITISRIVGSTTNGDFWVYDSGFNALACYGMDDPEPGTLTANFGPGTYYIAMSVSNLANDQPSCPPNTLLTGIVTDFSNAVANSSNATNSNVGLSITDGLIAEDIPLVKPGAFGIAFVRFTVGGAACACVGDMNGDSLRNGTDVSGFVAAVIAASGNCADVNGDTLVSNDDVAPFTTLILTGASCP